MNKRKNYNKFIATAATATLVATAIAPVASADVTTAASNFKDVSGHYKVPVDYLYSNGIVDGFTEEQFGTTQNIKRVDVAVMIARALLTEQEIDNAPASGFTDVPARAVKHVNALKGLGYVNGLDDVTFNPDAPITRGEVAMMLARAYKLDGNVEVPFTDVSGHYTAPVAALLANNITKGKSDVAFGTADAITRGELAIFLYKAETLADEDTVLADAIEAAEQAIAALPEEITLNEEVIEAVETARTAVDAVYALDADAELEGIETLEEAEAMIAELQVEKVTDALALETTEIAFINTSTIEVTLEEAEVLAPTAFEISIEDEAVEAEVTANEDNTVYTIVIADQAGEEVTVDINGTSVSADFTATAKQTAINTVNQAQAKDILQALKAPVLNLKNINDDLAAKYTGEISKSLTNTVERIQAAIDRINAEAAEAQQELVNTVNKLTAASSKTDIVEALKAVYSDDAVIEDLYIAYFDAIENTTFTTAAEIKETVDAVNKAELEKAVKKAETDLTQASHDVADTLFTAYKTAYPEKDVEAITDRLADVQVTIDLNASIKKVLDADAEGVIAAIEELKDKVDEDDWTAKIVEGNKAAYVAAFTELDNATLASVQAAITATNKAEAQDDIDTALETINNIGDAGNAEDFLTALDAVVLDLTTNTDNAPAYYTTYKALLEENAEFKFATPADVQAFIDQVDINESIKAVVNAQTSTDLLTALNSPVLELENVKDINEKLYKELLDVALEADEEFTFAKLADVQAFVNDANQTPVGQLNLASPTSKMRAAIENSALDLDLAVYNELTSLQKNVLAKTILEELKANATSGFATVEEIQVRVDEISLSLAGVATE